MADLGRISTRTPLELAAPDLLAVCEELLNCIQPDRDWNEARRARAAIAKAKGNPTPQPTYHTTSDSWGDNSGGHTIEDYHAQARAFDLPSESIVYDDEHVYERETDGTLTTIADRD
jgi:hypothetical protein